MSALFYAAAIAWSAGEIILAKRNERALRGQGAREWGVGLYMQLAVLYPTSLLCAPLESYLRGGTYIAPFAAVFFIAKLFKLWVIHTLSGQWVMRVFVWPGQIIRTEGPYRLVRHPNYLIMMIEFPAYSLAGGAWVTAALLTPAYLWLVVKRIRLENRLHYDKGAS